ncbi:MAG: HAMP domain-containing histidine kinase [Clostridiales bacterium]|nr:HAMP domain-containing histidine kinase [Clostridiales bacterium]
MRRSSFLFAVILTFLAELVLCFVFYSKIDTISQDPVLVNEAVKSVDENYGNESSYSRELDYVVLDEQGKVVYKTADGLSGSVNDAIKHNDTILDLEKHPGFKILINNTSSEQVREYKNGIIISILSLSLVQLILVISYYLYLHKTIIIPFKKLKDFSSRVAGGNLDIPLEMDRKNIFGSFTESFDIMRQELKKARAAEKKANDDKKEMVAKLSHDIKTPVASIKSSSEIGYEMAKDQKIKDYFNMINIKSDQITVLVDNLFNSSVQDITEIPVSPVEVRSDIVYDLIRNSDYLNKASAFEIPECSVFADKLRLQQSFDNIFMNSYKYADTDIEVKSYIMDEYLVIEISDKGPGVSENELPLLKEKYKRGSDAKAKDGAGLGLYLTDYFLTNMDGKLELRNNEPGFTAVLYLRAI